MSELSLYLDVNSGKSFGEYLDFLNGRFEGNSFSLGRMDLFLHLKEL